MTPTTYLAFGLGVIAGVLILAIVSSNTFTDRMGSFDGIDRREPAQHPDTLTLDFLETIEHSLFFNNMAGDAGMWGLLDAANKVVATGLTIRGVVARARDKQTADALAVIHGEPIEQPGEEVLL